MIDPFSILANKYFQMANVFPNMQRRFRNHKADFFFYKDSSRREDFASGLIFSHLL